MELREWLIILGLALVTLIVIDGVRRLQRQRRVPRLDQVGDDRPTGEVAAERDIDPEAAAREAEINWELPNGGARVVRPADYSGVQAKPKLQRQEHPGPSRVLSEFRRGTGDTASPAPAESAAAAPARESERAEREATMTTTGPEPASHEVPGAPSPVEASRGETRREPGIASLDSAGDARTEPRDDGHTGPLAADPEDHEGLDDEERYRLVDLEGMGDSLKTSSKRMGSSMHRLGASLQKSITERRAQKRRERIRREQEKAEQAALEASRRQQAEEAQAAEDAERRHREAEALAEQQAAGAAVSAPDTLAEEDVVRPHPVLEKALRHDVTAEHARDTLSQSEEIIVISVMSRDEEGFSGTALLDLMLACGLRYGRDMGIFHRFETEDPESRLQFSMVNVVKPGTFPIQSMDDFRTPGVTLLMPLPGAEDTAAAFEAMVETAMVIVRHLGGELKDEHQCVMTAQTVGFARQRVQEFERRNRLNRYQVN
ncbi:cell division protein ZipA [Halomonas cerina]|uniref:Cell division protein ZipA n=1 Tax=Halomonas cerina TaxID=447424 RepID=A0A839V6I6_9GAMM|nr:cell division protein ZipA [Halomonas cerina]MBB3190751.1 cell division protein ZipA [Halomonas cerina]